MWLDQAFQQIPVITPLFMHSQTGFTMGELMTECHFKMPINQLIKIEPQGKSIDGLIRGQLKKGTNSI